MKNTQINRKLAQKKRAKAIMQMMEGEIKKLELELICLEADESAICNTHYWAEKMVEIELRYLKVQKGFCHKRIARTKELLQAELDNI